MDTPVNLPKYSLEKQQTQYDSLFNQTCSQDPREIQQGIKGLQKLGTQTTFSHLEEMCRQQAKTAQGMLDYMVKNPYSEYAKMKGLDTQH